MTYQPIKRKRISEDVARNIMDMIREKELHPGDKLPSERELSQALQVSRTSLREGMRTLAFMNIIDIRSGDGTYVSSLKPEVLVEHLDFVLSIDDSSIFQLLQVRQLIEPELAAIAAEKITDEELEELNECLYRIRDNRGKLSILTELDVDLHMLIAQAAHNPFLDRFMASLRFLSKKSRERTIQVPTIRRQAQEDHEAIVAAINARNPEAARKAMRNHLINIESGLRKAINSGVDNSTSR